MLGNRPETVRERGGRTTCGGLEKELMTLNELRTGQIAYKDKIMSSGTAGDLITASVMPKQTVTTNNHYGKRNLSNYWNYVQWSSLAEAIT